MFWKKKIKCPIKQEDEMWITQHLEWLDENVVSLVDQPTFLPTKEYFDWTFTGSESDADFVLKQVGRYCRIITEGINLEFYSEESIELDRGLITQKEEGAGSAGMYVQDEGQFSILIEVQQLKKPLSLIATIAHELSHFILMGQRNIELEGVENEWLTDLLAIANGFGIFIGNTAFEFNQWQSGDGWGGWQSSMQGYLPQQITAHAMAIIEMKKSSEVPDWTSHLKTDFKTDFEQSMRYLIKYYKG